MKNIFDGLISGLDIAEKRISELEYRSIESSKPEKQREKKTENPEQNSQELWDNHKKV